MVGRSNQIMARTFKNDQNYHYGMLYDWSLNEIKHVDFKLEKKRDRTAEGEDNEYYVQFLPYFFPEYEYRNLHFKQDGKERFGFYLDAEDRDKGIVEKYLIVNKDYRVAFDRYNSFKCNWVFEWVDDENKYHNCLGCLREARDGSFVNAGSDVKLGGSQVDGELSFLLPFNEETQTIRLRQRFMVGDNMDRPQVYEVRKIKDYAPLGVIRVYCKQKPYNEYIDYFGPINEEENIKFKFKLPIPDLPEGFGGRYHAICGCIVENHTPFAQGEDGQRFTLTCDAIKLFINGTPVHIKLFETPFIDGALPFTEDEKNGIQKYNSVSPLYNVEFDFNDLDSGISGPDKEYVPDLGNLGVIDDMIPEFGRSDYGEPEPKHPDIGDLGVIDDLIPEFGRSDYGEPEPKHPDIGDLGVIDDLIPKLDRVDYGEPLPEIPDIGNLGVIDDLIPEFGRGDKEPPYDFEGWMFRLNDMEMSLEEMQEHFELSGDKDGISIKAVDLFLDKYVLFVGYGDGENVSNWIELEVKM